MMKYKYCTYNLEQSVYKVFTCPQDNCPDKLALLHTNEEFDKKERVYKTWDWWSTAYNCKISIRAAEGMNGKLMVQMTEVENANAFIYMQPNSFSSKL